MQQRKRTLMLAAVFLVAAAGVIAMRTWPTTGDEDQDRQTPEPRDASADVTADGEPSPGLRGSTDESPRPTAKGRDADPVETRELTVRVLASSNSAAVSDALVEVFEARKTSGVVVPLALVDGSIASGATSQQGTFVTKSAAGAALVVHV